MRWILKPKITFKWKFKDLHFAYSASKNRTIQGLNFNDSTKLNFQCLWVKSGCGKSTLVSLLMGFNKAQQGEILFNGQNASEIDRTSFYQKVSLVSHSSYVFKGSLRENMTMAKIDATDEQNLCVFRTSESCPLCT